MRQAPGRGRLWAIGATRFVDSRYNVLSVEQDVDNTALEGINSLTADLAGLLQNEDALFARIGVKTVGVEELIYTLVEDIPTP